MTVRINGQDVTTGDIDDGRPERMWICSGCGNRYLYYGDCICCNRSFREETDQEFWSRVEAMYPKSKDDLL